MEEIKAQEIKFFDNGFSKLVDDDIRSVIRTEIMIALIDEELGVSRQEKIAELIMERLLENVDAKLDNLIEYSKRLRGDVKVPDWRISMFQFLSTLSMNDTISKDIRIVIKVIMSACESILEETNDEELVELLKEIKDKVKI